MNRATLLAARSEPEAAWPETGGMPSHVEELRRTLVADMRQMVREELEVHLRSACETEQQAQIRVLKQELREMSGCIEQTRSEIAALKPADPGNNRIVAATGELDAIVSATERATSAILNSAERILDLSGAISDGDGHIRTEIQEQVTEVLTACSFQDITGQRTTKVVNTLRYLEQRVNAMMDIWGTPEGTPAARIPEEPRDTRPDAHLLNGPAIEGGVSQDEVDAMLADFEASDTPEGAEGENGGATSTQNAIDALFP